MQPEAKKLLYDQDTAEGRKQERASAWLGALWSSRRGKLSYQILADRASSSRLKAVG